MIQLYLLLTLTSLLRGKIECNHLSTYKELIRDGTGLIMFWNTASPNSPFLCLPMSPSHLLIFISRRGSSWKIWPIASTILAGIKESHRSKVYFCTLRELVCNIKRNFEGKLLSFSVFSIFITSLMKRVVQQIHGQLIYIYIYIYI